MSTAFVAATRRSARMGAGRRGRIAYLVLLQRATEYAIRACLARIVLLAAFGIAAAFSDRWFWAWVLAVPAGLSCYLGLVYWRSGRTGTPPRFWLSTAYSRSIHRTDSRHQLNLGSYLDIPGAFLLVVVSAWVTTDLGPGPRLVMLGAAVCLLVNVAAGIYNDQTWFNPEETTPPLWHEVSRRFAGLVVAVPVALIALPAPWPAEAWWAVVVLSLSGLSVSSRIWDTDLTLRYVGPLVAEESRAGRLLVVNEAHGALSTHLRLLEQQARAHRSSDPTLYELAAGANSRLRETLALANASVSSTDDPQALAAPVYTLARAVGARVDVRIGPRSIGADDRDVLRLVLADLAGNALNAGAGAIGVRVESADGELTVAVTDDADPIPPGVWKTPGTSSARLESRLAALGGGLEVEQQSQAKVVTARWHAHESVGALDEQLDAGPARRRRAR